MQTTESLDATEVNIFLQIILLLRNVVVSCTLVYGLLFVGNNLNSEVFKDGGFCGSCTSLK
jgi:hypothetical protein